MKTIQHSCNALTTKPAHTKRNHFVNTVSILTIVRGRIKKIHKLKMITENLLLQITTAPCISE